MARAKKTEEKPKEGATLSIDFDTFVKTRNSVITGLETLQECIQTLSTAYIKHTNAVLGENAAAIDIDQQMAKLRANPLLRFGELNNGTSPTVAGPVVVAQPPVEAKKEKKKRQHDPNAPKRPLTPFFLYMQTARPIIASDLGAEAAKGQVSNEGTLRWQTMKAADKQLWTDLYHENLGYYNARMHSYKAGNLNAKEMTDAEASAYAEEHNIHANTADAQLVGESSAAAVNDEDVDAEGEPEPEPEPEKEATPPPPKTPRAKSSRKSKGKTAEIETPAAEPIVPPSSTSSIVPPKAEEKVDKKRKRSSKKADEPVNTIEKEELAVETPKAAPKPRKKKAKADS